MALWSSVAPKPMSSSLFKGFSANLGSVLRLEVVVIVSCGSSYLITSSFYEPPVIVCGVWRSGDITPSIGVRGIALGDIMAFLLASLYYTSSEPTLSFKPWLGALIKVPVCKFIVLVSSMCLWAVWPSAVMFLPWSSLPSARGALWRFLSSF